MMRVLTILFFIILLSACKTYQPVEFGSQRYRIEKDSLNDLDLEDMIIPYREAVEDKMSVVLCHLGSTVEKGKPESTMGNWFADAVFDASRQLYTVRVDAAIQNYGGLRRSMISAGDLTVGLVYEVMPFDNLLDIVVVKGEVLKTMCDNMAESGGWPISQQLRFEIYKGEARNITVHNEPIEMEKIYNLAMPDYVINLGERIGLNSYEDRLSKGIVLREALIEHFAGLDSIPPVVLDGRIKLIEP